MSSNPVSPVPVKILVSLDEDGGIQVIDDQVLDLIAGSLFVGDGTVSFGLNAKGGNTFCAGGAIDGNNTFCVGGLHDGSTGGNTACIGSTKK